MFPTVRIVSSTLSLHDIVQPGICKHFQKPGDTGKHCLPPDFPLVHSAQFSDYQNHIWGLMHFACTESLAGAESTFT